MKKIFDLFKKPADDLSEAIMPKLKSTFFLTYVIVWILRNNLFIYNLFFNDKIKDKTYILEERFSFDKEFSCNFFMTLFVALFVMAIYYLFLNFSRAIVALSEDKLKLWIFSFFGNNRVKSLTDYDDLLAKLNSYKKNKAETDKEYRELAKRNMELLKNIKGYESRMGNSYSSLNKYPEILNKILIPVFEDKRYTSVIMKYKQSIESVKKILKNIELLEKPSKSDLENSFKQ